MNADHTQGWAALKEAEQAFTIWAQSNGISVKCVKHVATFERWDPGSEIYVFFSNDSELEKFKSENKLPELENQYRQFLMDAKYPFDRWPVTFYFDSHENVVKNYEGNYSYRLR